MKGRVLVRLKSEVLDPQGTTVAQALRDLGYESVVDVRQGRAFDVELDTDDADEAREMLEAMAGELLANPVIEVFDVRVLEPSAGEDERGQ